MAGYVAIGLYLALLAAALVWLTVGRKRMLAESDLYNDAMSLLDRCGALHERRILRVTAPTRACAGFYTWREMLPDDQAAELPERAARVQADSLSVRRELAEILMRAGQANFWLRYEVMRLVCRIEELSSPDFIVKYGYEGCGERDTIRVPVMAVYLDGGKRRAT